METPKFNFSQIPNGIKNNYSDIKEARKSREVPASKKIVINTIEYLTSFYQEISKTLSPERKQKINNILIGLAIATLSSDSVDNHLLEKEPIPNPTPGSDYSFEIEEVPQSIIDRTTITLPPIKIKNEPLSKIIVKTSLDSPEKESFTETATDASMEKITSIVEEIYVLSEILTKNEKLFPRRLFSESFLIAQSIAESDLKVDAQSEKGAISIRQLKPNTLKEDVRYFNILKKSGIIDSNLPQANQLTQADIEKMCELAKSNPKYGEAFGNIYLMDLYNNFKIGQKDFTLGGITKARKKIITAYNWNPASLKKHENQEEEWPEESQNYYKKIIHYMEIIATIEDKMVKMKLLTAIHDLSPILTLEIKKYERELNAEDPRFDKIIEKVMSDYLNTISEMEKIKEKPLTPEEIKKWIDTFNPYAYKNYRNNLAKK